MLGGIFEEGADRGHLPRRRRCAKALPSPVSQERSQIRCMEVEQGESPDLLPAMAAEKLDQPVGGGDIGPHRMRAAAAIMGEMAGPARGERPRRMSFLV